MEEFPFEGEGDRFGECWAVSAHRSADCTIEGGAFDGMTLSRVYREHRELFGGLSCEEFPLLTKIIDARENLSIQVHPDDAYAAAHEKGARGKTECWYILDAPKDARLIVGHKAQTRQELEALVKEGRYEELLGYVPVKKGSFIQIEPGTIHAITGGILLLETQQSSDVTYRVYDYGRLMDGKPRPLHVKQSLEVIRVPDMWDEERVADAAHLPVNTMNSLVKCEFYQVWKASVRGHMRIELLTEREAAKEGTDKEADFCPFLIVSVTEGEGTVDGRRISKGSQMVIPCGYGSVTLEGEMELICSTSSER